MILMTYHLSLTIKYLVEINSVLGSNVTEVPRYVISLKSFPSYENVMEVTFDK